MGAKSFVVFHRAPGNYDPDAASSASAVGPFEDGKTQQNFKDECDINTIMRKFGLGVDLPQGFRPPVYGDFEHVMDFQTAMNAVVEARESFMSMPPELRARFHNDPQELIEFMASDANREEAVKLGLVNPPPAPPVPAMPAGGTPPAGPAS